MNHKENQSRMAMAKASSIRVEKRSEEYRRRLRSAQTPVRRSPRFLQLSNDPDASVSRKKKEQQERSASRKAKHPTSDQSHLQAAPISPDFALFESRKKTQQRRSAKCHREPLRPIDNNTEGFCGKDQEKLKPLVLARRSARLASNSSIETIKESAQARSEKCRLVIAAKISEQKENVGSGGAIVDGKRIRALNSVKENEVIDMLDDEVGDNRNEAEKKDNANERKRKRKVGVNCKEKTESEKAGEGEGCGFGGWTKEQEAALQRAYIAAKPSPNFWKKVSKMVAGKSAQECFDKVNESFATPNQPLPRSRTSRCNLSPISNFSLSGSKSNQPAFSFKKLSSKKKSLVAQKTVRLLLRKHCAQDQSHEADHFSVLETSPTVLSMKGSPQINSPIVSDSVSSPPGFLQKSSGVLSSTHSKMLSRFKPLGKENVQSPEVLKRIKNMALHEKYIDQLHNREARRKFSAGASTTASRDCRIEGDLKTRSLQISRSALMSDAKDCITQFQRMQANSLRDFDTTDEDDNDGFGESDDGDDGDE